MPVRQRLSLILQLTEVTQISCKHSKWNILYTEILLPAVNMILYCTCVCERMCDQESCIRVFIYVKLWDCMKACVAVFEWHLPSIHVTFFIVDDLQITFWCLKYCLSLIYQNSPLIFPLLLYYNMRQYKTIYSVFYKQLTEHNWPNLLPPY